MDDLKFNLLTHIPIIGIILAFNSHRAPDGIFFYTSAFLQGITISALIIYFFDYA